MISLFALSAPAFAADPQTLEEACQGEGLKIDGGLCRCEATKRRFNPLFETDEKVLCEYTTQLKKICTDDPGSGEKFLTWVFPDRCYCKVTRDNLSEAVRSDDEDGRRTKGDVFYGYPEMKSLKSVLDSVQSRVDECKVKSRAILAHHQTASESGCSLPTVTSVVEHFTEEAESIEKILARIPDHELDQRPGARTVLVTGTTDGNHGGRILQVSKRTESVHWENMDDVPDVQGSPEYGAFILGPTLSRYFGYSRLEAGKQYVTMPDFKEIQGAERKLNDAIHALNAAQASSGSGDHAWGDPQGPISTRFYDALPGTVTPKSYLKKFADDNEFPVGTLHLDGEQLVYMHDASFHVPSMLLNPPSFIEAARTQIRSLFEFEDYFKRKHPEFSKDVEVVHFFSRVYLARALQIDNGSVLSATGLNKETSAKRAREQSPPPTESEIEGRVNQSVQGALRYGSPFLFGYRNDGGQYSYTQGDRMGSGFRGSSIASSVEESIANLDRTFGGYFVSAEKREALRNSLSEFVQEKKKSDPSFTRHYPIRIVKADPEQPWEQPYADPSDLEATLLQRKEFLEKVVHSLESGAQPAVKHSEK